MSWRGHRVCLWIAGVALAGALAPAPPEVPSQVSPVPLAINVPLAKEQLKLIDLIIADHERLVRGGEIGATDPNVNYWARRRLDVLRASGAGKAEMIDATQHYLDRIKAYVQNVKTQYKMAGLSRHEVYAAEYERLAAEMRLNDEKAR